MKTPAKLLTIPDWFYERREEPYAGDETRTDPTFERLLELEALKRRDLEDYPDAA